MENTRSGGIGVLGLLGVLFVGLKLGGVIAWSWWLVLLPFYFSFAIVFAILVVALVLFVVSSSIIERNSYKRWR